MAGRHGFAAIVAGTLAGSAALSGCGQKGPLVLPVPPKALAAAAAANPAQLAEPAGVPASAAR